ncbi:hypothetical protein PO002_08135 [Cupriavidus necator]|uniref:hypothetical protein n=1 Tax=Cupriavidus necator TaxID=106590 RepID=UPI0039C42FDA
MVKLAHQYPLEPLYGSRRRLRVSREISERKFLRTQEILRKVERVKTPNPSTIDDVARAVVPHYDDPPVPVERIPTAEQAGRVGALAAGRTANHGSDGLALSHDGWCAFMGWLTDAL